MPGTGHSARYKGSISNRVRKSPFQQLAEWNAQLLGADGAVPSIVGGGGLEFKKLDASDIDGVMHNPATKDLDMNGHNIISNSSFNITSNGVLDISANAGLTLSSIGEIVIGKNLGTIVIGKHSDALVHIGTTHNGSIPSIEVNNQEIHMGRNNSKIGFFGQTPITRPGVFPPAKAFTDLSGTTVPGAYTFAFGTLLKETIMNNAESLYCLIRALDHNAQGHAGMGLVKNVGALVPCPHM